MTTPHRARFADFAAQVVTSPYGQPIESSPNSSSSRTIHLSTINSQLLTHGWTKRPLSLEALSEKNHNEVISVLFELLGSSVSNLETLDNLAARHRTLEYEYERATKNITTLRNTNARLEGETMAWKSRCAELEKRLCHSDEREKGLREEVGRGRKALESVRIAAGHENKKIQMKLDKAQAQLAKISMDASLLGRPQGMVLLNPISGGRTHPEAPGHSPLLEQSLKDLAEIRQSLQEETEAFRHVIVSTGNGLREALAAASGEQTPQRLMHSQFFSNASTSTSTSISTRHLTQTQSLTATHQSASSTSHPSIADARLRSLIASVRDKLVNPSSPAVQTESVEPNEADVEGKEKVERERERLQRDLEDRIKDLEVEIVCSKGREEEAKRLVDEWAKAQLQASMRPIQEKNEEEDELAENVRKQKELLDEERKKFTEAAVRLGQERRQLEIEREAFHEERRRKDVESMLAFLPPTPETKNNAISNYSSSPIAIPDPSSPFLTASSSSRLNLPEASSKVQPLHAHKHKPKAPSPLSPYTHTLHNTSPSTSSTARPLVRTPKAHHAGAGKRKSSKTPLSRLVLEKAVREKGRGGTNGERASSSIDNKMTSTVLGEDRGKRTNLGSSVSGGSREVLKAHGKGKGKSVLDELLASDPSSSGSDPGSKHLQHAHGEFKSSITATKPSALANSQRGIGGAASALTKSTSTSTVAKVDLSKADGIGPRAAARGTKVWR